MRRYTGRGSLRFYDRRKPQIQYTAKTAKEPYWPQSERKSDAIPQDNRRSETIAA